jgi:hypothetical protein
VYLVDRKPKGSWNFGEKLEERNELLEARILTPKLGRLPVVPAKPRRNPFFEELVEAVLYSCCLFRF